MKHTDEDLIEAMSFQMAEESERADKLTQGKPARPSTKISNVEAGTCGESKKKNQGNRQEIRFWLHSKAIQSELNNIKQKRKVKKEQQKS